MIIAAIALRLREANGPHVVVVGPDQSPSAFDRLTMDADRHAAIRKLREGDLHGRLHAYSARPSRGSAVIVHSKVVIVDDRLVRVGSANLNNYSLVLDSECDVVLESRGEPDEVAIRRAILAFRHRLIDHYIGRAADEIEAAIARLGSLHAAI